MIEKWDVNDRAAWMARRTKDITASDIGAACGVSHFKTPLKLFHEKIGTVFAPSDLSAVFRRGLWLEPSALFALRQMNPTWDIRKVGIYIRDTELRMGCTADLVAVDPLREGFGVIQVKTVALRIFREGWLLNEETIVAPLDYQLQTLMEAKLTGASWAVLAALVTGEFTLDLHVIEVPLNDKAWERVLAEVKQLWWHIDNGMPPPYKPYEDNETFRELWPRQDEKLQAIDLSANNELPGLLEERSVMMARIKADEIRKTEIETHVMAAMGEHRAAVLPGWSILWKVEPRAERVVAASEPRVLRVNRRK